MPRRPENLYPEYHAHVYFGPATVAQARALVEAAGRELPVAADFVAAHVPLAPAQALVLARGADGTLSLTIEDDHA